MKSVLVGAVLALLLVTVPGLAAALLAVLGAVAVTAASSPVVWAFAAGLLAAPRIAQYLTRSTR